VPDYVKSSILPGDPFQSLDQSGVGALIEVGITRGRQTRPNLKVGICGEHGGEAESVKFCHRAGMNYVSCSPYRVPIARLAAAQAVVEQAAPAKAKTKAAKKVVKAAKSVKKAGKKTTKPAKKAKKAPRGKK
jgi:pyruvate, orthophosphate dikinase